MKYSTRTEADFFCTDTVLDTVNRRPREDFDSRGGGLLSIDCLGVSDSVSFTGFQNSEASPYRANRANG